MKKTLPAPAARRTFLKQLSVALALPALPALGQGHGANPPVAFPAASAAPGEDYWELIKKQFAVPANRIMVNAANLCPSPYVIAGRQVAGLHSLGQDVSFQHRAGFEGRRQKALDLLAAFLNVKKEELGITRNTTESNNIIVNGLDLKPGDEVVIWEQNHPTNGLAWEQRARRYGFKVVRVALPAAPASIGELIQPFAQALTRQTRVLAFSHISNTSGIALPARELCQLARSKGILSLVDGAQSFGALAVDLQELGCDFYSGSAHKWLMGPVETGILYVRQPLLPRVWPTMVSAGWKEGALTVDEKLCVLGQRNDLAISALPDILEFHQAIGRRQIEDRVRQLSAYLKAQIRQRLPQASFVTPQNPALSAGIVIISLPGKKGADIYQQLYEQEGIACAATGGIRISPHIYNTLADLDRIVSALVRLSA